MASILSFPLEGDGIIENLYHYLWTKDELDSGPNINIPDTVVYRYRQPAMWFFTSSDGSIKKKNKSNLVNVRIEEAFLKNKSGSDIVAYYISTRTEGAGPEAERRTTIEYLDERGFREFLYQRTKVNNGILQRFIEPKGVHNSMTRVIWSPKVCLLERRVNLQSLQDRRVDMYQRAVTYDGEEFNSKTVPVRGSILPAQVQNLAEAIVSHVAEVSFQKYKISRMVLNMKVSARGKLYLLWCSSLRVDGTAHGDESSGGAAAGLHLPSRHQHLIKPPSKKGALNIGATVKVPPHIRLSSTAPPGGWGRDGDDGDKVPDEAVERVAVSAHGKRGGKGKASAARDDEVEVPADPLLEPCPSCGRNTDVHQQYEVQYKTVVSHYEQLLLLLGLTPHVEEPKGSDDEHDGMGAGGAGGAEGKRKSRRRSHTAADEDEEDIEAVTSRIPRESLWPSKKLVLSASGAVGLIGVYPEPQYHEDGRPKRVRPSVVKDIPPVIAHIHPKLSNDDYRRYRRDPLFLFKTVPVCEDCFLVFADVASNVMQGMEPGSAVHRIMGPLAATAARRRNVPVPVVQGARMARIRARERAEKAAEEALRASYGDTGRGGSPSRHRRDDEGATPFNPDVHPPALPQRVKPQDVAGLGEAVRQQLLMGSSGAMGTTSGSMGASGPRGGGTGGLPSGVANEIIDREHEFFSQLSQNPNLHRGHPLAHMIESYPKLPQHGGASGGAPASAGKYPPGTAQSAVSLSSMGMGAGMLAPSASAPVMPLGGPAPGDMLPDGTFMQRSSTAQFKASTGVSPLADGADPRDRGGATLNPYTRASRRLPAELGGGLHSKSNPYLRKHVLVAPDGKKRVVGPAQDLFASRHAREAKARRLAPDEKDNAAKHAEFLAKTMEDVKRRMDYPEQLQDIIDIDAVPAQQEAPVKKKKKKKPKLQQSKSWREMKADRLAKAETEAAEKKAADAKAKKKADAERRKRLEESAARERAHKAKAEKEAAAKEEAAKKAAMEKKKRQRAEKEAMLARREAREKERAKGGAAKGGAKRGRAAETSAASSKTPAKSPIRTSPKKEKKADLSPYKAAKGNKGGGNAKPAYAVHAVEKPKRPEPEAKIGGDAAEEGFGPDDVAALDAEVDKELDDEYHDRLDAMEKKESDDMTQLRETRLKNTIGWKISGRHCMVKIVLDKPERLHGKRNVIALRDEISIDVSSMTWMRRGTPMPTPATTRPGTRAEPKQAGVGDQLKEFLVGGHGLAAPTHQKENFSRAAMEVEVYDTHHHKTHVKLLRCLVFGKAPKPAHIKALEEALMEPDVTEEEKEVPGPPLPHVLVLTRLLDSLSFKPKGGAELPPDGDLSGVRDVELQIDEDFLMEPALRPMTRGRPIAAHTARFGDDFVIVSLHMAPEKPGTAGAEALRARAPKFVLQAYNYTEQKYMSQYMTKEQLLTSQKPFLQRAAAAYLAEEERWNAERPSTAGVTSPARGGAGGGDGRATTAPAGVERATLALGEGLLPGTALPPTEAALDAAGGTGKAEGKELTSEERVKAEREGSSLQGDEAAEGRPIHAHAQRFDTDLVIVSLHHDPSAKAGERFILQAFNYTKRKYMLQHLTRDTFIKSNRPFLKAAAAKYFPHEAQLLEEEEEKRRGIKKRRAESPAAMPV